MRANIETDPHRLQQRQKQIDFGKATLGYQRYLAIVPKDQRRAQWSNYYHPRTPRKDIRMSKRGWDGRVRRWRNLLHLWDDKSPLETKAQPAISDGIADALPAAELGRLCDLDKLASEVATFVISDTHSSL